MKHSTFKSAFIFVTIILFSACSGEPVEKVVTKIDSLTLKPVPQDSTPDDVPKINSDSIKDVSPKQETETGRIGNISEGIVYYTLPYCGGARPSEEIVADKKRERLLTNSTLKLVNQKGDGYVVTTDDKGIFKSGILPGTYDVYLTEKTNKEIYNVSPETCENCLTKKMQVVTLTKGVQAKIVVHFACAPGDKRRQ